MTCDSTTPYPSQHKAFCQRLCQFIFWLQLLIFGDFIIWNSVIAKKKPEKPVVAWNSERYYRRHLAASSFDVASLEKRQESSVTARDYTWLCLIKTDYTSFGATELRKSARWNVFFRSIGIKMESIENSLRQRPSLPALGPLQLTSSFLSLIILTSLMLCLNNIITKMCYVISWICE